MNIVQTIPQYEHRAGWVFFWIGLRLQFLSLKLSFLNWGVRRALRRLNDSGAALILMDIGRLSASQALQITRLQGVVATSINTNDSSFQKELIRARQLKADFEDSMYMIWGLDMSLPDEELTRLAVELDQDDPREDDAIYRAMKEVLDDPNEDPDVLNRLRSSKR